MPELHEFWVVGIVVEKEERYYCRKQGFAIPRAGDKIIIGKDRTPLKVCEVIHGFDPPYIGVMVFIQDPKELGSEFMTEEEFRVLMKKSEA